MGSAWWSRMDHPGLLSLVVLFLTLPLELRGRQEAILVPVLVSRCALVERHQEEGLVAPWDEALLPHGRVELQSEETRNLFLE